MCINCRQHAQNMHVTSVVVNKEMLSKLNISERLIMMSWSVAAEFMIFINNEIVGWSVDTSFPDKL